MPPRKLGVLGVVDTRTLKEKIPLVHLGTREVLPVRGGRSAGPVVGDSGRVRGHRLPRFPDAKDRVRQVVTTEETFLEGTGTRRYWSAPDVAVTPVDQVWAIRFKLFSCPR